MVCGLLVTIVKFVEDDGPVVKLIAEIMVAKENHKPIVIGGGGQILKKIGTASRLEIEKLLDRRVYMDLNVTTKANWQRNPGIMKDLGYVVAKA